MNRTLPNIPAFLLFLFLAPKGLNAQSEESPPPPADSVMVLKEVTLTYEAGQQTPVTYQNISAKEIELVNTGQEPSFILSQTPSVTAYSDAANMQGYSYFRIRGIDQTRINMTLDGVPLNEPEDQGAYFSNYPDIFNSVSVQVQRGVGTTQNGTSSYGGSIQLYSPDLRDSAKTTAGLGYGSFNTFRGYIENHTGLKKNKSLYARVSQLYSDGYKYHSSNNSQSAFISGGLFFDKSSWKINLLAGRQQNQMAWLGVADSLISADPRSNGNEDEQDQFSQAMLQLHNTWTPNPNSVLNTAVYHTILDGNYDFDLNNYLGLPSTNEMYNYAFKSGFSGFFTNYTHTFGKLALTTGFHGNVYNRQHTGSERREGQLYQNTGLKNELSAFSKGEYTLSHFQFYADIQYRYTTFDYNGTATMERLDWRFINPKAGVSYSLNRQNTLYYGIGKTGREPTRNDIFGGEDDLQVNESGQSMLHHTEAEYVVNHELGLRSSTSKYSLQANLFYMDFRNEIVPQGSFGPNGLALTRQFEKSFRSGAELHADINLNRHWNLTQNFSWIYSRLREAGTIFRPILTPPLLLNQEIVYNTKKWIFALNGRYQSASYINFANTEKISGYFLLSTRAHYSTGNFLFSLHMNNVTNTRYFNHGYIDFDGSRKLFIQAPASFFASVKYTF